MKNIGSLLALLLALCCPALAQKAGDVPEIVHALKLDKELARRLSTPNMEPFQIEGGEIMRARKGWEIYIDQRAKVFVFRKTGASITAQEVAELQFAEYHDGIWLNFCYCPSKSSGKCKITFEQVGNDRIVRCEGNCDCDGFSIFDPPTSPPEVQHPSEGWQKFPLW
jgi:hypothetical protein